MSVVSDSSPLIALARVGQIDLLPRLYERIVIPLAVRDEVYARRGLVVPEWIEPRAIQAPFDVRVSAVDLGAGEKEAIALALQMRATLLLLDDRQARALARKLGVSVLGVGGVLVAAKQFGALTDVRPVLDELTARGFRMSRALRADLLLLAGESEPPGLLPQGA